MPDLLDGVKAALAKMTPGPWADIAQLDNDGLETDLRQIDGAGPCMVCQELSLESDAVGIVALVNSAPVVITEMERLYSEHEIDAAALEEAWRQIRDITAMRDRAEFALSAMTLDRDTLRAAIEQDAPKREQMEAEVERLKLAVMAHKTWENEAVAQASNANLALNKIRVENRELRQRHAEEAEAALELMVILGPLAADAAIVGGTYGWNEVIATAQAVKKRHDEAVEAAWREGLAFGLMWEPTETSPSEDEGPIDTDQDAAWLASSAHAALEAEARKKNDDV